MKQLKQFCAAALLTMAIGITAFAGDIQSPGYTEPPPPGDIQSPTATTPVPGEMGTPGVTSTIDPVSQFTLDLFAQLLSIF